MWRQHGYHDVAEKNEDKLAIKAIKWQEKAIERLEYEELCKGQEKNLKIWRHQPNQNIE